MIDDKDKKILNELMHDSRQSFREIAKKIGVSTVTVMKRVKKLEKDKILTNYYAMIDYEKAGYEMDVLINLKIAHGKYDVIYEQLKHNPNISSLYNVTGAFDAVIFAKLKSRKLLDNFLKELQSMEHIEETNTVFILRVLEKKRIQIH